MDLVQLKIKGTVITSRYGTLSSGDILRTDAAYAKHLVEECGAAEYIKTEKQKTPAKPASKPKKAASSQPSPQKIAAEKKKKLTALDAEIKVLNEAVDAATDDEAKAAALTAVNLKIAEREALAK